MRSRCIPALIAFLCGFPTLLAAQPVEEEPPPQVDCDTHATNEGRSNPQQLAKHGIACFEAKEYTKALRYYRLAYLIEQSPLLTAAIGRSFQELGYPALAKPYFVNFLNDDPDADGREKIGTRLKNVETALKNSREVDFQSFPPEATVYLVVDGEHWEEIGTTPVSLALLGGDYEVVVQREGFVTQTRTFTVRNEDKTENFDLIRSDATFDVPTRKWRKRGVALIVAATPFLAGGATLFALGAMRTSDAKNTDPDALLKDDLVREGVALKQWGIIAGAIGLTAFATGVVFYVSGATPKRKKQEKEASTSWWVSPQGVGFARSF